MVVILRQNIRLSIPKLVWHVPLVVREPVSPPVVTEQDVAEILNDVADDYRIHPDLILGKRRELPIVTARHAWIAAVMRTYKLSLSHGARLLQLDRDTIRNALKKNLQREVERSLRENGHIV